MLCTNLRTRIQTLYSMNIFIPASNLVCSMNEVFITEMKFG